MTVQRSMIDIVDGHRAALLELSHDLHAHPEVNFEENYSSKRVADVLDDAGFDVERGVADLSTAFRATTGSGSLDIGVCAEYDALPKVGHACGHNIIASAAVGAALALQPLTEELDITVTVLGTPAEEGGGGKVFMLQRGAFDGLHAALMVHPAAVERDAMASLAVSCLQVEYFGVSAHAAAAPHRGVSASAAVALAQVGIGMLREHFEAGDRVHGVVDDGGGAPNVVPAHTSGRFYVRSLTSERRQTLEHRIIDVFKGAAMMTGCTLRVTHTSPPYADIATDARLAKLWRNNAAMLGRDSMPAQDGDGFASTDMGNVSQAIPSIHPLIALESAGANIHEAAFAEFASSPTGDRAVVDGAILLAQTIVDIARDGELRNQLSAKPYAVSDEDVDAVHLSNHWEREITFDPADTR